MRILIRITVTGEMLRTGQHIHGLKTFCVFDTFDSHLIPVLTKGAVIDHRVIRIAIDIYHRCEVHLYPHTAAAMADLLAHLVDELIVADSTERELMRKDRHRVQP